MIQYDVSEHAPSFLPEGRRWRLCWSDEFDGERLDESKWSPRLYMMGQRAPHWVEDAARLDGQGNVVFSLEKRNGVYCTTQLQTGYNFMDAPGEPYNAMAAEGRSGESREKNRFVWPIGEIRPPKFAHRYGYYECRCRLPEKPGWWVAFWLQSPIFGATMDPAESGVEVDIMEAFRRDNCVQTNNHWNGYGCQHQSSGAEEHPLSPTPDGYHRFGLEWSEDGYRYYYDGCLVREINAPVSHRDQFVLLSAEAVGYRSADWHAWEELARAEGDTWTVDYVRVFDKV